MITFGQLKSHVEHALGGSPASQLSSDDIVNQAGRHFYSHQWKFRMKGPVDITLVADEPQVSLPPDTGQLVSVYMKDGLTDSIRLTTIEEVIRVRNTSISTGANYIAAMVWPPPSSLSSSPPRLELAPTPTSEDVVTVAYLSDWEELILDDSPAPVPTYCDSPLIQTVRAFALGYEEENMTQRIMEVESSPIFMQALSQDGLAQPDYGPLRNGVVSGIYDNRRLPFDTIANPSS